VYWPEEKFFVEVKPVIDNTMRSLCVAPYPDHAHGCPNFNKKRGCPPSAPLLKDLILLDIRQHIYAIYNVFDFKTHCDKMREKHPDWSRRQIECCLYWQGTARKHLKKKIEAFLWKHPHYIHIECPEAAGVNLTETMRDAGITLEWPPVNYAYQIALAGIPVEP